MPPHDGTSRDQPRLDGRQLVGVDHVGNIEEADDAVPVGQLQPSGIDGSGGTGPAGSYVRQHPFGRIGREHPVLSVDVAPHRAQLLSVVENQRLVVNVAPTPALPQGTGRQAEEKGRVGTKGGSARGCGP